MTLPHRTCGRVNSGRLLKNLLGRRGLFNSLHATLIDEDKLISNDNLFVVARSHFGTFRLPNLILSRYFARFMAKLSSIRALRHLAIMALQCARSELLRAARNCSFFSHEDVFDSGEAPGTCLAPAHYRISRIFSHRVLRWCKWIGCIAHQRSPRAPNLRRSNPLRETIMATLFDPVQVRAVKQLFPGQRSWRNGSRQSTV